MLYTKALVAAFLAFAVTAVADPIPIPIPNLVDNAPEGRVTQFESLKWPSNGKSNGLLTCPR